MEETNIIYLRVSTNEDRQDLDQQLKAIIDKFELKDYKVFKDEASAYKTDKFYKREQFLDMLELIFESKDTIMDLFLNYRYKRKEIHVYVWDTSRIMRNMEMNLLFFICCKKFNIKIHSWKDEKIFNEIEFTAPNEKMIDFFNYMILSYGSEMQSYDTSKNIKRSFNKDTSSSVYGIKLGKGYKASTNWKEYWSETITNLKGKVLNRLTDQERLRLTPEEEEELKDYIRVALKNHMRKEVIGLVQKNKGIILRNDYFTRNFKGL